MRIVNPIAILGEDMAVDYLTKKGYKIIERNFRKSHTEIDIIAITGSTLVFIEVKARKSNSFGSPFEGIDSWKVRNLVKTAQYYKLLHPQLPNYMRIDAVGIFLSQDDRIQKIEHIENISGF